MEIKLDNPHQVMRSLLSLTTIERSIIWILLTVTIAQGIMIRSFRITAVEVFYYLRSQHQTIVETSERSRDNQRRIEALEQHLGSLFPARYIIPMAHEGVEP